LDYKNKGPHGGPRQITATNANSSVVFDVTDKFGIGGGSIRLVAGQWPETVLIRLHLAGLEGFSVSVGNKKLIRRDLNVRMLDAKGIPLEGRYLRKSTGPNTSKRIVGYFEAKVPRANLMDAEKINLNWVDFYRR
jgi:hypothetical protein